MAEPGGRVSFAVETFASDVYAREVAAIVTRLLPSGGSVVITGGTTAANVYSALEEPVRWEGLDVMFSDERCVPPDHPESNFKMAHDLFLGRASATVHRMPGEADPAEGARAYGEEVAELVAAGPHLALLGMGADCHIGAIFPGSEALSDPRICAAVPRPDGMWGLTLTPPALLSPRRVLLLVTGAGKAAAVERVVRGDEATDECPALLLATHPDVTFLLDEAAAARL